MYTLVHLQAGHDKLRSAANYWADEWEEHLQAQPELRKADREVMKVQFDCMQAVKMREVSGIPKASTPV